MGPQISRVAISGRLAGALGKCAREAKSTGLGATPARPLPQLAEAGLPWARVASQAIVLLGCRIAHGGRPASAAQRRVERAARAFHEGVAPLVVVAGGRTWHGISEADALSRALAELEVPSDCILKESWSLTTAENARYVGYLLQPLSIERISVVTCDWHLPRALRFFRAVGFSSEGLPAPSPPAPAWWRLVRDLRERGSTLLGRLALLLALLVALCSACQRRAENRGTAATRTAPADTSPARVRELGRLESLRDSRSIGEADLSSREPSVRRAASRALARIADERAHTLLGDALADEDPEVVIWSAYGLGYACRGREPATVRKLASRAASLGDEGPEQNPLGSPSAAIADALARCGGAEAERTLRSWLNGPAERAESAALALGRLAWAAKRLDDSSLVALLDAADRPNAPVKNALFPFTRIDPPSGALAARLLEVARHALAERRGEPSFAVRALGKASASAAPDLAAILTAAERGAAERADAARALAALGDDGQKALLASLPKIAPAPNDAHALASAAFGVVLVALDALAPVPNSDRAWLEQLAAYPLPASKDGALTRRAIQLRCAAARVVANTRSLQPALVACDPDPHGRTGLLAVVKVLDRGELTGTRLARWQSVAESTDAVVRQAALDLMSSHPEIRGASAVLTRALAAGEDGTVAAAARVLAAHPDRVSEPNHETPSGGSDTDAEPKASPKPSAELAKALEAAFSRVRPPDSIEVHLALVDAAAALELLSFKSRFELDCKSSNPSVREHAATALQRFGDRRHTCSEQPPYTNVPPELEHRVPGRPRLRFLTDAGELHLTLDSELAPLAVARFIDLARAGFYDGMAIHRVIPGFVTQFGDRRGDGFGGADRPALPCETSPLEFRAGRVGVALSGRDTGSSQFFVTLGPEPHLNGDYALIGEAEPGWDRLVVGDVIHKAEVLP